MQVVLVGDMARVYQVSESGMVVDFIGTTGVPKLFQEILLPIEGMHRYEMISTNHIVNKPTVH